MDSKDYKKVLRRSNWEKVKTGKGWRHAGIILRGLLKLMPIGISILALIFSVFSFTHSKYTEKLTFEIRTDTKVTDIINFDGSKYEVKQVEIRRNTGYIDKTSIILFHDGKFKDASQMPTSSFITEIPFGTWLQPEKTITRIGSKNLPIYYDDEHGKFVYYYVLIHGMDNSKHLYMITHLITEQKRLTKPYSEVTIFGNETSTPYFKNARKDFLKLKSLLTQQNLL